MSQQTVEYDAVSYPEWLFPSGPLKGDPEEALTQFNTDRVLIPDDTTWAPPVDGVKALSGGRLHHGPGGSVWRAEDRRLARKMRLPVAELRARSDYPTILYEFWDQRGQPPEDKVSTGKGSWAANLEPIWEQSNGY